MKLQQSQFLSMNELQEQYLKKSSKIMQEMASPGVSFEEIWKQIGRAHV